MLTLEFQQINLLKSRKYHSCTTPLPTFWFFPNERCFDLPRDIRPNLTLSETFLSKTRRHRGYVRNLLLLKIPLSQNFARLEYRGRGAGAIRSNTPYQIFVCFQRKVFGRVFDFFLTWQSYLTPLPTFGLFSEKSFLKKNSFWPDNHI